MGHSTLIQRLLVVLLGAVILCNAEPGSWEARCWPVTEWGPVVSYTLENGEGLVVFDCPEGWEARLQTEGIVCSCGARAR